MLAEDVANNLWSVDTIKDLGGWGVVVWIVWWLTSRWEKRMDLISQAISAQTATLGAHTQALNTLAASLENHRMFSQNSVAGIASRLEKVGDALEHVCDRINAPK